MVKAGYPAAVHGPFTVGTGPGSLDVELRLSRGTTGRGRLDGFSGDGWRLWIEAIGVDREFAEAAVAADGSFTLSPLAMGPHRLHLARAGDSGKARGWSLDVPDHDLDGVTLRSVEGDCSLDVVVTAVRAVSGAEKGSARVIPLGRGSGPLGLGQRRIKFTGGAFREVGLPAGPCRVEVTSGSQHAAQEVEVRATTTIEITVGR